MSKQNVFITQKCWFERGNGAVINIEYLIIGGRDFKQIFWNVKFITWIQCVKLKVNENYSTRVVWIKPKHKISEFAKLFRTPIKH